MKGAVESERSTLAFHSWYYAASHLIDMKISTKQVVCHFDGISRLLDMLPTWRLKYIFERILSIFNIVDSLLKHSLLRRSHFPARPCRTPHPSHSLRMCGTAQEHRTRRGHPVWLAEEQVDLPCTHGSHTELPLASAVLDLLNRRENFHG